MRLINFGIREDYGKEFYFTLLSTKHYSLFQIEFDICEYSSWTDLPYLQISSGYGKLFSFLFSIGKLGISFDILGRNWSDRDYYVQPNETSS
jgi:hypothetical protein